MVLNTKELKYIKYLNILCLSNNPVEYLELKKFLNNLNFNVSIVTQYNDVYKYLQQTKYDILMINIQMQDVHWLANFINLTKKYSQTIKVILITEKYQVEFLSDMFEIGIDKYIVKPQKTYELILYLNAIVDLIYFKCNHHIQTINLNQHFKYVYNKKVIQSPNKEINLTQQESFLLELLINYKLDVLKYEFIQKKFEEENLNCSMQILRTLIKDLRKKTNYELITNIPQKGYKINLK